MKDLIDRLRAGVPSKIERWPGNDGEDIVRDIAGASRTMTEAADALERANTEGRIEAFEFLAKQFRTYADDNEEIHRRYGTKGKAATALIAKRSQTFRDAADDCDTYAAAQREELEK